MKDLTPIILVFACALGLSSWAGPYVTETSGIRWNDVGGIRWNDVGGIRWNDVGGIRWNDVGGLLFSDASGVRWNDVGGVRWNDVGSIVFNDATITGLESVDLVLLSIFTDMPDSSSINVIITYYAPPTANDLAQLNLLGIPGGTLFRHLPMVVVNATKQQIQEIAGLPAVRSIYSDKVLSFFDGESAELIGLPEVATDPEIRSASGQPLTGAGVTIAVLDSGVDGTHPDLPAGSKVVENVRLNAALPVGPGFVHPTSLEGQINTDVVLGHGTFVASVAAGTGQASGGLYAGAAPGASVLALSAGDFFMFHVLEGFDYILEHAQALGVRVVNCSWGTQGWFDPDDPVNIATRLLHDAGITVIFAAGNHGPAPDTLNPYAVAPWVLGVGATSKSGALSEFSSRGIYEELLYHPTLVAPGAAIVAAKAGAVETVFGVAGVADPTAGQSVPPQHAAYYTISSGTSFAAPHVAGVVALLLEADPQLTPVDIKRILQATATPILTHDRSEVGAGRLDAWAALSRAIDAGRPFVRPFGTHIPGWLDERPYRIEHLPAVESAHLLPAGGTQSITTSLAPGTVSWQLDLAWGLSIPESSDLDLRVLDSQGTERARSESINGLGLFGRAEGAHLLGQLPSELTVEVYHKLGSDNQDQEFFLRSEIAVAELTAYDDLGGLDPGELEFVTRAVSRNLIRGRGRNFEPDAAMTRGELARSLALIAGLPQRIPSSRSFNDVGAGHADFPYIESAAGTRARQALLDPRGPREFKPNLTLRRLDAAVGLVRAAGLRDEAEARSGEGLNLADVGAIPDRYRGYVAVALEQGLLEAQPSPGGSSFEPSGKLSRLLACQHLLRLLALREASEADGAAGAAAHQQPRAGLVRETQRQRLRRAVVLSHGR